MLLPCLISYVVDVTTTVADVIATCHQGERWLWMSCVADGIANVSILCQL